MQTSDTDSRPLSSITLVLLCQKVSLTLKLIVVWQRQHVQTTKSISFTELAREQSQLWWKSSLDHRFRHRPAPEILRQNRIWCLNLSDGVRVGEKKHAEASQEVRINLFTHTESICTSRRTDPRHAIAVIAPVVRSFLQPRNHLCYTLKTTDEAPPNLFYSCGHVPIAADELTLLTLCLKLIYLTFSIKFDQFCS